MKRFVRRLLGLESPFKIAAEGRPEDFVAALSGMSVTLLGLKSQEGITKGEMSETLLLDEIQKNLADLELPDAFTPLITQAGAEQRMGVFTSESDLHAFTREYVRIQARSFVFQTFVTSGDSLGYFSNLVDRFELNPMSKHSVLFTDEHMKILRHPSKR